MTTETEYCKINGKFVEVLTKTSNIKILGLKYFKSKEYGTTHEIQLQIINKPEFKLDNLIFVLNHNNKYVKEYTQKWNKTPVNTISLLGEFLQTSYKDIKDCIQFNNINIIQDIMNSENCLIKISGTIEPNNPERVKVFNIATELHQTVTFSDIRNSITENFNLPISTTPIEGLTEFQYITESMEKGEMIWNHPMVLNEMHNETFKIIMKIVSGKNTQQDAIQIINLIKVGSCDNLLRIASIIRILRVGDWRTRFNNAIVESRNQLQQSLAVIEEAITKEITLEQGFKIINQQTFGLKDPKKIEQLQKVIKQRFDFEFITHQKTLWSVSQALTNVGSHPEQYAIGQDSEQITENNLNKLREIGYDILLNPNSKDK